MDLPDPGIKPASPELQGGSLPAELPGKPMTIVSTGNNQYFIITLCAVRLVTQMYLTLCDSMDYSPPGSSVHGDYPGKNPGVHGCALLQGNLPDPGFEPVSLMSTCIGRQVLYH